MDDMQKKQRQETEAKGKRVHGEAHATSHRPHKKKKRMGTGMKVGIILVAVLLLAGAAVFGYLYFNQNYVLFHEKVLSRETEVLSVPEGTLPEAGTLAKLDRLVLLDLSGRTDVTTEQADALLAALPSGCSMLWNVPLTDGYFKSDAKELKLPGFTEEDAGKLHYFTELTKINASGSKAYAALQALSAKYDVTYTLSIGDAVITNYDTSLQAEGVKSVKELEAALAYFPELKSLDLRNGSVPNAEMLALQKAHPELDVTWTVHIGDKEFDSKAETVDLTGITFASSQEALDALGCLTQLKEVDLRGTGLTNDDATAVLESLNGISGQYDAAVFGTVYPTDTEELNFEEMAPEAFSLEELQAVLPHLPTLKTVRFPEGVDPASLQPLCDAYPQVLFVRTIEVFSRELSSDTRELDISGEQVTLEQVMDACARLPLLEKLVMCDCGLNNEQMDKLLAAYPKVKFVWIITVGPHTLRTDAIGFSTKNPSKYTNPKSSAAYNKLVKSTVRLYEGDIENLKYCTDLEALDLGHNYLTNKDLKVIAGLTHLKVLILADNKITDISALKTLQDLEYIELFMCKIKDMSPLASLQKLTDVNIANTGFSDLKPLYELKNLKRLWYSMNGISRTKCKELAEYLSTNYGTVCNYTVTNETDGGWREGERYNWMRSYFN